MTAVKKIYDTYIPDSQEPSADIPEWKKKKSERQKILRAIRAKSFTETIRTVIRKEIKKVDPVKE